MSENDKSPTQPQDEASWQLTTFDDLSEKLKQACERAGWSKLMPVQERSMGQVMQRKDIMVQARTGSGKTGAFVLPLIERIDPEKPCCQALVLLPTRELAKQVAHEAEVLSGGTIRTVPVYGGVGYGPQVDGFKKGAHLVVGTPGRILDHLMRGNLDISELDTLVFDEADRMLSIGFYPDMKQLQTYLPNRDINGLMFSATFPPMVVRLSQEFLTDPTFISLSEDHMHVAEVAHIYYQVPAMGKERVLAKLIETENPNSAIIFTNTKANCNFVAAVLNQFGYNADPLSSDLTQAKREQVLDRVRAGKLRFLVATDVAARGIDIPELSHVFLYEPPEDRESYIHRSGRTGRAGAAGVVISLVDVIQKMELLRIGTHYKIPLEARELPEDKDVRAIVAERTTALLEAELRAAPEALRARMAPLASLGARLAGDFETTGLMAMLLDDYYHSAVHANSLAPVAAPAEGAEPEKRDEDAIVRALEAAFKAMKPLSRERMMKFYPMAQELAKDDEGSALLALLLDRFASTMKTTDAAPRTEKAEETDDQPQKKRRSRSRKKPRAEEQHARDEAPDMAEETAEETAPEAEAPAQKQAEEQEPEQAPEQEEKPAPKKKRRSRSKKAESSEPETEQAAPPAETPAPEAEPEETPEPEAEAEAPKKKSRSRKRKPKTTETAAEDAPEKAEAQPEQPEQPAQPTIRRRVERLPRLSKKRFDELLPEARELLNELKDSDDGPALLARLLGHGLDAPEKPAAKESPAKEESTSNADGSFEPVRYFTEEKNYAEPDDYIDSDDSDDNNDDAPGRPRKRRPRRRRRPRKRSS